LASRIAASSKFDRRKRSIASRSVAGITRWPHGNQGQREAGAAVATVAAGFTVC
jgi:hypothetical protein